MHVSNLIQRGRLMTALSPAAQNGSGALAMLMRKGGLHCVFQPMGDLRDSGIFAHEALICGPQDSALQMPDALLEAARREDILQDFELFCLCTALQRWGILRAPGRLFVNISANTLVQAVALYGAEHIGHTALQFGVATRMVVLEITEHDRVADMPALCAAVKQMHAAGLRMALDDFGDGRSSLRVWSEIKPDFVKIDKYFIRNISERPENLQMVQAIKGIAAVFGTALIAEGIETADDLRTLRELNIPYGQGWLLGPPERLPRDTLAEPALAALQDPHVAVLPHLSHTARPAVWRSLQVLQAPTVTPETPNDKVAAVFQEHLALHALAVVEQGKPLALINRQQFMDHYATLYFRELHGRKPCIAFANQAPRIVEMECDVDQLVGILTSQDQRYLSDGVIITDNARYVGLGTGDQLVRTVTETRIEAARHANPLTFLPGNIPISMHIERLLKNGTEFFACYADLNDFKPFNDHYGYWRGDEMIRLVAQLIVSHCDARRDFVGHVGGDDFLILFQSSDWLERCTCIVEEFAQAAQTLFDDAARQAGGIHADDRHGVQRFFPCTTLAIGAARIQPGQYRNAEQVASRACTAKHEAKLRAGCGVVVLDTPTDDPALDGALAPEHTLWPQALGNT